MGVFLGRQRLEKFGLCSGLALVHGDGVIEDSGGRGYETRCVSVAVFDEKAASVGSNLLANLVVVGRVADAAKSNEGLFHTHTETSIVRTFSPSAWAATEYQKGVVGNSEQSPIY